MMLGFVVSDVAIANIIAGDTFFTAGLEAEDFDEASYGVVPLPAAAWLVI